MISRGCKKRCICNRYRTPIGSRLLCTCNKLTINNISCYIKLPYFLQCFNITKNIPFISIKFPQKNSPKKSQPSFQTLICTFQIIILNLNFTNNLITKSRVVLYVLVPIGKILFRLAPKK